MPRHTLLTRAEVRAIATAQGWSIKSDRKLWSEGKFTCRQMHFERKFTELASYPNKREQARLENLLLKPIGVTRRDLIDGDWVNMTGEVYDNVCNIICEVYVKN